MDYAYEQGKCAQIFVDEKRELGFVAYLLAEYTRVFRDTVHTRIYAHSCVMPALLCMQQDTKFQFCMDFEIIHNIWS